MEGGEGDLDTGISVFVVSLWRLLTMSVESHACIDNVLILVTSNNWPRLMSCTPQETMDMASPAMQLSSKIPDKHLQAWAASLLAGAYTYMYMYNVHVCMSIVLVHVCIPYNGLFSRSAYFRKFCE